jgi:hypothetical protein
MSRLVVSTGLPPMTAKDSSEEEEEDYVLQFEEEALEAHKTGSLESFRTKVKGYINYWIDKDWYEILVALHRNEHLREYYDLVISMSNSRKPKLERTRLGLLKRAIRESKTNSTDDAATCIALDILRVTPHLAFSNVSDGRDPGEMVETVLHVAAVSGDEIILTTLIEHGR